MEHASKTNIGLNFPFPGFTLLENDRICPFYVNLCEDMDPLESRIYYAFLIFFPNFKQAVLSQFFDSEKTQNRS